jgi:type III pantothenate kinase
VRLLVDAGNSRLKWACAAAPGAWRSDARALPAASLGALLEEIWCGLETPEQVVLCSVLDPQRSGELEQWMGRRWGCVPMRVHAQRELLGVINHYRVPASLGADRWAALIAARHGYQGSVCVVDCGSAVTVDALSGQGEFLGGVILPGLAMSRRALFAGTAGVQAIEGEAGSCFARATGDAVAAGTLFGLAGAIERVIEEQCRVLGPNTQTILTGGDAVTLAALLRLPAVHDPDLVLRGLDLIATIPA